MLTFCIVIFFGLSGPRAQTFTQVNYNFPALTVGPDIVADGLNSNSMTLTMNSLAANGTGQWTLFPGGVNGNWALLGNHLFAAASDASYHGGIVQTGTLANPMPTNPDEIKGVANLQGSVRYICPDPSRNFFTVQGFDEAVSDMGTFQIDFSFMNGSSGMELTDPTSTVPVKSAMRLFSTTVSTFWTGDNENQPIIPSTVENPRDEFDVAIDNTYLYITWETYTDGLFKVFAIALRLSDGSVASGPVLLGSGTRPTIASDFRSSPFTGPSFDVAWIPGPASQGVNYRTMWNGVLSPVYLLTRLMQHPGQPDETYSDATHVRIVVGSAYGAPASPNGPRAIYAIVHMAVGDNTPHLVLYEDVQRYSFGTSWTPEHAYYVDGTWLTSPHPVPIDGLFPVDDDPIIAFANPYDGQGEIPPLTPGTTPFNEYHCLYRLHRTYVGGVHDPLMIVRGADHFCSTNAMNVCLNASNDNGDPRTINRPDISHVFWEDPAPDANGVVSYIGAVNQMGIHCHWRSSTNNHYYMRDSRAFDEMIEENTLATYATTVRNGSDHQWAGGANGTPFCGANVTLALWCEPTTNEFALAPGNPHAPMLNFSGTNTSLQVVASRMVTFPTFLVNFTDPSQQLFFGDWSAFDYYGNSISGSLEHFAFSGSGGLPSVILQGDGATMSATENGYPTSISYPATLNIHGGCGFTTTTAINFAATNSEINCLEETPYSGSGIADGFDYCMGSQAFTSSIIYGGTSGGESQQPAIIQGVPCNLSDNATQFSMTNCLVQNIGTSVDGNPPGSVQGIFQNNPNTPNTNYRGISINGGQFDGAWFEFDDPMDPVTVSNSTFVNIDGDENGGSSGDSYTVFTALTFGRPDGVAYGDFLSSQLISVSGCTFKNWTAWPNGDNDNGRYWPCVGIYVKDFVYINSINPDPISITDNTFTNDGSELAGSIHAAIYLDNSCGTITGNIIKAPKFMIGIEQDDVSAWANGGLGVLPTLICSNDIENLTATGPAAFFSFLPTIYPYNILFKGACGLFIDNMSGDEQFNILKNCNVGRFGGLGDQSHMIFSNIQNCTSYGIVTYGYPSMSGYHYDPLNSSPNDIAGWNVVKGNHNASGSFDTQIYVYDVDNGNNCYEGPTVIFGNPGNNWTVFGDNDVESGDIGLDIDGYFPHLQIPDPSGNYWGGGDMDAKVFPYGCFTGSNYLKTLPPAQEFSCTSGGFLSKQHKVKPLSIQTDDTLTCYQLYLEGQGLGAPPVSEYYEAGDTLKYYVEHCYSYSGFNYNVFGNILSDFEGSGPGGAYPGNGDTLPNLLQWFFSVLYLNTDTQYYCADAISAGGCLQAMWYHDSSVHANPLNGFSGQAEIEKYLIESGKCPFYAAMLQSGLNQLYPIWYRAWKDTVKDSLLTPWDTTLPTLQQIGFEALLGSQAAVQGGIIPTSVLGNIGVAPNPFTDNTVIDYTLNVPATLTVEVFNVLGQRVAAPVPSVFTNNGDYSLTLTGSALASGTYYVRFSVPEGEVRTIMLTKE